MKEKRTRKIEDGMVLLVRESIPEVVVVGDDDELVFA
jgi:hypothetical protein